VVKAMEAYGRKGGRVSEEFLRRAGF